MPTASTAQVPAEFVNKLTGKCPSSHYPEPETHKPEPRSHTALHPDTSSPRPLGFKSGPKPLNPKPYEGP